MHFLRDLLDLLLPTTCPGCRSPGALCRACLTFLQATPKQTAPTPPIKGLPKIWTITTYEGPIRNLLIAHKERAQTALAVPLGQALAASAQAAAEATATPLCLIPVPSAKSATRRRGHNPLAQITKEAIAELTRQGQKATHLNLLTHARKVADQSSLTATQRTQNLAGALAVTTKPPRGQLQAIVVDDLITTGATLKEATRALTAAGLTIPAAATIATTPRHHP